MVCFHTNSISVEVKKLGDHLWQGRPYMAAILSLGGPSMAAKIAIDDPRGPLTAGDQLWHDRPYGQQSLP